MSTISTKSPCCANRAGDDTTITVPDPDGAGDSRVQRWLR